MKEGKNTNYPHIVEVIPITKGLPQPTLSYFTEAKLEPGNIIKIPIRTGESPAIVQKIYSARGVKTELKNSNFTLRKLGKVSSTESLPQAFIDAAMKTAAYYSTSVSSILSATIPQIFLENLYLVVTTKKSKLYPHYEPILIQIEKDDRISRYKGIIREAFARKCSVMLVAPTHEDVSRLYASLSVGIEEYAYMFSLALPEKKLLINLNKARGTQHPILYVTTPTGIAFHRSDFKTVIIERENSRAYWNLSKPYFSYKKFIEHFAQSSGGELVEGDAVLSIEALFKERNGESRELFPLKWRLATETKTSIVDMKKVTDKDGHLVVLGVELRALIDRAIEAEEKILLFGARKGLSPTTVCGDCGHILLCTNCNAPLVLHETKAGRIFACHSCRAERASETRCDNCNSWKLRPLGIGIDLIVNEVKRLYPEVPLFILDKDHAKTRVQAEKIVKSISSKKAAIIVGTEQAIMHLPKVAYTGVVSLDTLFGIPDFSINERIFYLISNIRELTKKEVILQTRNVGKEILNWAAMGNISDFYRNEIKEREELNYPPYSIFIKVSTSGNEAQLDKRFKYLSHHFNTFKPEFIKNKGKLTSQRTLHMIIRRHRASWPELAIINELALLTTEFLIKVDPESLL